MNGDRLILRNRKKTEKYDLRKRVVFFCLDRCTAVWEARPATPNRLYTPYTHKEERVHLWKDLWTACMYGLYMDWHRRVQGRGEGSMGGSMDVNGRGFYGGTYVWVSTVQHSGMAYSHIRFHTIPSKALQRSHAMTCQGH